MASEYLLKKYKDVKPDEVRELTKEEKRRNWWYYNKWTVVISIAAVILLGDLILTMLGVGRVNPDYNIAYVGPRITDEQLEAIRAGFAEMSADLNGDGKVIVELQQYLPFELLKEADPTMAQAEQARLIADLNGGTSCFFLLDDPDSFQASTFCLRNLDGTLPEDEDESADGKYYPVSACPALSGIDFGGLDLAFARRGYWSKAPKNAEALDALWDQFTADATLP